MFREERKGKERKLFKIYRPPTLSTYSLTNQYSIAIASRLTI